ncbi:unnamed protein product [Dovyalis caffra]|uniref:Uncharacterized protein n=1 Tax=Dovyalis caffra TaxID=77055 RepID=A0AAV1SGP3_9ROSI|nr:unnamed protein product [Dovyalis caffra]
MGAHTPPTQVSEQLEMDHRTWVIACEMHPAGLNVNDRAATSATQTDQARRIAHDGGCHTLASCVREPDANVALPPVVSHSDSVRQCQQHPPK